MVRAGPRLSSRRVPGGAALSMPWLVFGSSTPSATGQFSVLSYNVAGLPLGM
jgi:hypothetical protein